MRTLEYFNNRLAGGYRRLTKSTNPKPTGSKHFEVIKILQEQRVSDERLYEMVSEDTGNLTLDGIKSMPIRDFLIKFDTMITRILTRRQDNERAKAQNNQRKFGKHHGRG